MLFAEPTTPMYLQLGKASEMKITPLLAVSCLLAVVLAGCTSPIKVKSESRRDSFGGTTTESVTLSASGTFGGGADSTEQAPPVGFHMTSTNADLGRVAKIWERELGNSVTITEPAKDRRVFLAIAAPSKDELRRMAVAALRANGIDVIDREGGVVFDILSESISK
jgi:hypothetical protein